MMDPWQKLNSWFPDRNAQYLAESFPSFLRLWCDSSWQEPLRLIIHWYLESNKQSGAVQGSIILSQCGLELLSWVVLIEKGSVSEKDFNDKKNQNFKTSSKKINRLLEKLNIDTKIPASLTNLIEFESKLECSKKNGPYALTEVRNSITHANSETRNKLYNTPFSIQREAYELSLWYLELILLRIIDYQGSYFNRLSKKTRCEEGVERVPWAKT